MHRSQAGQICMLHVLRESVDWSKLLKAWKYIGFDWRDKRLIVAFYKGQRADVRLKHRLMSEAGIGCGTRQGALLSPILFISIITQVIIEIFALSLAENSVIFRYNHLRRAD